MIEAVLACYEFGLFFRNERLNRVHDLRDPLAFISRELNRRLAQPGRNIVVLGHGQTRQELRFLNRHLFVFAVKYRIVCRGKIDERSCVAHHLQSRVMVPTCAHAVFIALQPWILGRFQRVDKGRNTVFSDRIGRALNSQVMSWIISSEYW